MSDRNARQKSEFFVVPQSRDEPASPPPSERGHGGRTHTREEPSQGRESRGGGAFEGNIWDLLGPSQVSPNQERIATLARQMPDKTLTALCRYLDEDWLLTACARTRQDGAVGIDGETWADFAMNIEERLRSLCDRAHSGLYRAPPVRRVHIPKGTGPETRPIGIPTFEDKVLQRAVVMLLEPIYEPMFHAGSFGFRPGRGAHDAIDTLRNWLNSHGGGWVVEVDIRKFFDTLVHKHLREFVQRRVGDGVVLRLIGKWLNAGVMEEGLVTYPEEGSPQGGVISPLLANIYLHYVLDDWFETQVKPRLKGQATLIRYADDFVIACTHECDATALFEALPPRFAEFGLTVHETKSRQVRFTRPRPNRARPETFDLLGFTWYWGQTRYGGWTVKTKTASSRLSRALTKIADWCKRHRHDRVHEQSVKLSQKLRGHYAYYGRPGNYDSLSQFFRGVQRSWYQWLSRRSWHGSFSWSTFFARLLPHHPLPTPRIASRFQVSSLSAAPS
jgi:RNA-directed DNA polymerase